MKTVERLGVYLGQHDSGAAYVSGAGISEWRRKKMAKPVVQLVGEDGNAFAIMGRVSKALKGAGLREEADAFTREAMRAGSYAELVGVIVEKYVTVT